MRALNRQQASIEADLLEQREQIARDFWIVNGTPEGERVFGYLISLCRVFRESAPEDCNPNMTLFNEGQRSIGNEIVTLLTKEPHKFKARAATLRAFVAQAEGNDE